MDHVTKIVAALALLPALATGCSKAKAGTSSAAPAAASAAAAAPAAGGPGTLFIKSEAGGSGTFKVNGAAFDTDANSVTIVTDCAGYGPDTLDEYGFPAYDKLKAKCPAQKSVVLNIGKEKLAPGSYGQKTTPFVTVWIKSDDAKFNKGGDGSTKGNKPSVTFTNVSATELDGSIDFEDDYGNAVKGEFKAVAPPAKK